MTRLYINVLLSLRIGFDPEARAVLSQMTRIDRERGMVNDEILVRPVFTMDIECDEIVNSLHHNSSDSSGWKEYLTKSRKRSDRDQYHGYWNAEHDGR